MKSSSKQIALIMTALICSSLTGMTAVPKDLPDPDGKPADMSKPVKVFILLGQSNMLGFGNVAGGEGSLENATKVKKLYPYLVDDAGSWTTRKNVRNVRVMCSGSGDSKTYINDWMTITGLKHVGPEIGIGHYVGEVVEAPVLILKSCIGNRSLGYDLLPPSAAGYEGDKDKLPRAPKQGVKGWYAGVQYDGDVAAAQKVLDDLGTYYPGASKYEVAGFCFWQGAKDGGNPQHSADYEKNLVSFIKDLRKDFNAPNAMFVVATMGHGKKGSGGNAGLITDAQLAVDGKSGKHNEFKGNVATFYSNPVSKGGSANGHYSKNAETYMNVGEGMGLAMAQLLVDSGAASGSGSKPAPQANSSSGSTKPGKTRTWTDTSGNQLRAVLVGVKDGNAILRAVNGRRMPIPLTKLSAADQKYIEGQN